MTTVPAPESTFLKMNTWPALPTAVGSVATIVPAAVVTRYIAENVLAVKLVVSGMGVKESKLGKSAGVSARNVGGAGEPEEGPASTVFAP